MSQSIKQAAAILRAGRLVAFPTETVYGLGADANNAEAVRRIFQAKERPYHHPLIVHIGDPAQVSQWARAIPVQAHTLMQTYWPGPLTIIFKKQPHVLDIVTGGQDTIGLRIPHHPIALALLNEFGSGIAAPSANKFTHISPTTAADVQAELGNEVDCILDGGSCEVGLESTIIDMSTDQPTILRPGMISQDALAAILDCSPTAASTSTQRAPGMHHLHYAPSTQAVLVEKKNLAAAIQSSALPVACMMIGDDHGAVREGVHIVNMPADAVSYAHDLYHTLRLLDNQKFKQIIIEAVPAGLEWEAIRDRLKKATAEKR